MQAVVTGAVALYGDPLVVDALGQQEVGDLGRGLGLRHPVGPQARPPGGRRAPWGRARPAGCPSSAVQQLVGQTRCLRGVEPATEADAGRHHDDVDRVGDDLAGRLDAAPPRRRAAPRRARARPSTHAPRRVRAPPSSSARRWAVTRIRQPARTGRGRSRSARRRCAARPRRWPSTTRTGYDGQPDARLGQALAGGEVEDLLVHRRGHRVAVALPVADAARRCREPSRWRC